MQSYGIIGITLWRNDSVYGETTVSLRRNCSVPPQKLSFPTVETVISNAGNDSSPPGNGKSMYTINFCPPGELAYVRFILCCRYFICNLSATVSATFQLFVNQCITRVWLQVADVFMFFQLYRRRITHQNQGHNRNHKPNSPLCPPCPLW